MGNHLVLALARLEIQIRDIHFLQAKGTLFCFLFEVNVRLVKFGWSWTGFFKRRANLFIAPVRVLYACEDGGLCLK
jgi:hypothetical protein